MIKYALKRLLLHSHANGFGLLEWIIVWTIYWGDYLFWGKDAATDVRLAKW